MTTALPDGWTLDDIAPEDLRIRAENVTAALAQLRVTLLPLCDLADELLRQLNDAVEAAELRLRRDGEHGFAVIDELDSHVGARALASELHLIHEASDYELMYSGWRSDAVAHLRAVELLEAASHRRPNGEDVQVSDDPKPGKTAGVDGEDGQ